MSSEYMEWAKTRSHARFNLASSGVANLPLSELPVSIDDIEISGPSFYGYPPLQQAIAAMCEVDPECVVAATGTSMANHLAMAAIVEAGDEILIEHPGYEPLVATALYLGATVTRFPRSFEAGFEIDPAEIARRLTPRTRLIVVTNLHNPSSALTGASVLVELQHLARTAKARVLIDEVYLGAAFERAPHTVFHVGPEFVVTNSLTKVYGLSGLRCGWILAEPDLASRIWRLNDLFGVIPAHPAERLSLVALANLATIRERARKLLDTNRAELRSFFASRPEFEGGLPEFGTMVFPRLELPDVDSFCARLMEKYETSVVPGRFFGMPAHVRIGIGADPGTVAGGLERLADALDEIRGARLAPLPSCS